MRQPNPKAIFESNVILESAHKDREEMLIQVVSKHLVLLTGRKVKRPKKKKLKKERKKRTKATLVAHEFLVIRKQ